MTLTPADFEFVCTLLHRRAAVLLGRDKLYLAETRLSPVARRHGLASVAQLVARLRAAPTDGLHDQVVEAMVTNETSFFRDHYPFEGLRKAILPELVRRRAAQATLNVWCAACSTGQEPYSIAMLLREHFPELAAWKVRLIATDLSAGTLRRARAGRFSQWEVNRGLPARLLAKYFREQGTGWQIAEELRNQVEFRQLNLIDPWPAWPLLDVVFLRNVLIYFDTRTRTEILGKVRRVLQPDGYLFLGSSESTVNLDDAFECVRLDRAACYALRRRG